MTRSTILLVDDDPHLLQALRRSLRQEPYEILVAGSGRDALALMERRPIDVVVSDERMPGMSGSRLLAEVHRRHPDTIRIMLTGQASLEAAVRAINEGQVFRFFLKPCNEAELKLGIARALQFRELLRASRRLLDRSRLQSAMLEQLQAAAPGITQVRRDESGAILLDEEDVGDVEELLSDLERWFGGRES